MSQNCQQKGENIVTRNFIAGSNLLQINVVGGESTSRLKF